MIFSLLFAVFLKAFLLFILLYVVARDEADFDFRKVTMVTTSILLGTVILDSVLTRFIGLFTLIPIGAFIVFMVMQFCWVRFGRSLLVAIPFLVLNIMISTAVSSFQQKADAAIALGLRGPVTEEDMNIALSFYQQGGSNVMPFPMRRKMPEVLESLDQILLKRIMALIVLKKDSFILPGTGKTKSFPPAPAARPALSEAVPQSGQVEQKKEAPQNDNILATESATDWRAAEKKIRLTGAMVGQDGVRVAIVNNQMIREGECIQVEHKKLIYRWRAGVIRENKVSWVPVEAVKK